VRRCGQKWVGHEGEDAVVHLRRLTREAEELRKNQGRQELGEEGIEDSITTYDFINHTDGRANNYTYGFTIDTGKLKIGLHLMSWYKRCKEKQRGIAEREA
jgi:hypothetical protein